MQKYAIIDIETTGGKADRERITEIAIAIHDGEKIIDSFETLINPEISLPFYITQLTGITDTMLRDAPKFYEVAKQIVQMTEGAVFVAHNVRFDYSFVQQEFKRLGYTYSRKQLCTVRMSREAFPGLGSYSLENLINHFRIKVKERHRAMADVLATSQIFEMILTKSENRERATQMINLGIKESQLPANLNLEKLHELPEACGVYYLHDVAGEVVYVGKSINIKKRIFEHFADKTEKAAKLQHLVNDISYEITGSELVALLLESHEIKRIRPKVNKAQRAVYFPYGVFALKDEEGYIRFQAVKNVAAIRKKHEILIEFEKLQEAKGFLKGVVKRFELCEKKLDSWSEPGVCFAYHIKQCHGACKGEEPADSYNERALQAIERMRTLFEYDFLVVEPGKGKDEQAVVLVKDGNYQGFGYVDTESELTIGDLKAAIKRYPANGETNKIIKQYIRQIPLGAKVVRL